MVRTHRPEAQEMPLWFAPACPLETGEKLWTESRMRWLAGTLGIERLLRCEVILPEPRYFPDPYAGTHADARRIFDRVCGYMGLEPGRFDLDVVPEQAIPNAAGQYKAGDRPRVVLSQVQLADPVRLVATFAHELAHDILLGGGLISREEPDHEEVTDLVPVFLGLGLFAANATVRDRSYTENQWHFFRISKDGYLNSMVLGYALALFAYVRGEGRPAWARYLRLDAGQPLKRGLNYLRKTGDALFHPETIGRAVNPPTQDQVVERLATGSPTVRAMTLQEVATFEPPPDAILNAVVERLSDRDLYVRLQAVRALPSFGAHASIAVPSLFRCLESAAAALRTAAAGMLATLDAPAEQVVPELVRLLRDPEGSVVDAAARGLGMLAPAASSAAPALMQALCTKEIRCEAPDIVADAIVTIDPPQELLRRLKGTIDHELRPLVTSSLDAARLRWRASSHGSSEGTASG
jgi:hypothetical protein